MNKTFQMSFSDLIIKKLKHDIISISPDIDKKEQDKILRTCCYGLPLPTLVCLNDGDDAWSIIENGEAFDTIANTILQKEKETQLLYEAKEAIWNSVWTIILFENGKQYDQWKHLK